MANNSVSLHRVFKAPPEKIYRAFTEPHALASWIPPYGFVCVVHEMEAKAGGHYRASFTNFSTGNSHSFGGRYLELRTDEFIKYIDKFENPALAGEMTITVWIKKVSVGAEIHITAEGIPQAIPVEACYLGWQESLEKLKMLVEPNIPDM